MKTIIGLYFLIGFINLCASQVHRDDPLMHYSHIMAMIACMVAGAFLINKAASEGT